MMRRVYKYDIKFTDLQTLELPMDSQLLHSQMQAGILRLWVSVVPSNTMMEKRHIRIVATGEPIEEHILKHISTFQQGLLVWHIFEVQI